MQDTFHNCKASHLALVVVVQADYWKLADQHLEQRFSSNPPQSTTRSANH